MKLKEQSLPWTHKNDKESNKRGQESKFKIKTDKL